MVCHDVYKVSGLSRYVVERVLIEIEQGAELERQAILVLGRRSISKPPRPLTVWYFVATGGLGC